MNFKNGIKRKEIKDEFPDKPTSKELKDKIDYTQKLIDVIEANHTISEYPQVKEKMNLLKETVTDDIEQLRISRLNSIFKELKCQTPESCRAFLTYWFGQL